MAFKFSAQFVDGFDDAQLNFEQLQSLMALQIPAQAYRAGALSLPSAATTAIAMDTISFDEGKFYKSGSFACPTTGYYQVGGAVRVQLNNNPQIFQASVLQNNALAVQGAQTTIRGGTVGDTYALVVAGFLKANLGDKFTLACFNNGGNACSLDVSTGAGNFLYAMQVV